MVTQIYLVAAGCLFTGNFVLFAVLYALAYGLDSDRKKEGEKCKYPKPKGRA